MLFTNSVNDDGIKYTSPRAHNKYGGCETAHRLERLNELNEQREYTREKKVYSKSKAGAFVIVTLYGTAIRNQFNDV